MKTVMINASPKKKLSATSHFLWIQRLLLNGNVVEETLRNKADTQRILETVRHADAVLFGLPMYVDGVPSHVLSFMKELEKYSLTNNLHLNVYVISNGGFIEGNQNEALMNVFENFCDRSGLHWCGGIGIGGGVMLNVLRIMAFVMLGIFLLNLIAGASLKEGLLFLTEQLGWILFFHVGVLFYSIGMGTAIRNGREFGVKFTRAMVPSFLFILITDVFFTIFSLFKGGIFRGWLSRKQPSVEISGHSDP